MSGRRHEHERAGAGTRARVSDDEHARPGVHSHVHEHDGAQHTHAHHHVLGVGEEHVHGHGFERYTLLDSPLHDLDPRAKVLSAVVLSLAVVIAPPLRPLPLLGVAGGLLVAAAIGRLPIGWVLRRSALVIPFAGTIALFAPLGGAAASVQGAVSAYSHGGWIAAYAIISKAWLTTLAVVVAASSTPTPLLLRGLERLHVPRVMLLIMTFMYRYVTSLGSQLSSARNALESRGFGLRGWRKVRLYGNLAGTMFIRGYERSERVYAAMLSRGFDGSLPTARALRFRPADAFALALAALTAAAVLLH